MSDKTASEGEADGAPSMRTVVVASSAGTAFEWYDFFIFGALASIISRNFFAGLNETAGLVAALALFGAGFAFRPLGALIFGRMGDRVGRKAAFLVTVTLMGGATLAIGFLPTYAQAGLVGPALLIVLRILQGLALGGEYGGAAIYVAEHAPARRRGEHTSWIQASAAFGLIGALGVILVTRRILGEEAFADWGWRVPFLLSAGLLAVSIFMRLKLAESPSFARLKAAGEQTKAPFAEAFGQWPNLKIVLLVLFAFMSAQGAVWYTTFFYVQIFLERFLKVEPATVNTLMICATLASAPLYVMFAWLSDRVGRKWVMWFGMTLALLAFFPGFKALTLAANPALAEAQAATPVVVFADPADCALQFDPIGRAQFTSACDIAKTSLANAGVSYENLAAPPGAGAEVRIGQTVVVSADGSRLDAAGLKTVRAQVDSQIRQALADNGYPAVADPARTNLAAVFGILMIFVVAATALYGPMAAALVELFPTRIRYTAMSLPYHIGTGWVGGFVPFSAFAIVTATGNIYSGLWYPVIFTAISVVVCLFLPETKGKPLD
ncbi:MFS transporter [Phenylobacterium sp.]|uniref:MFS transporter n=1 Tax=Phenylobacterium sp. TaxID=1871053 RepID=UPI002731CBF7|nr:MFS transporter [Phenylobacterium sp.]MDP1618923.1 MFS transporter [Phenylobacterium sp.]MDP1987138.1 MFS transporter [Phenylobacterium sp.]